jgi:ABC-type dipeptide/oligopeptide/nickel transport system permease subunit
MSHQPTLLARLGLSPSAYVGLGLLILFVLAGLFGPLLAPHSPETMDLAGNFQSPSWQHWLGTDQHGRDVLSQMLYGARIALVISVSVVSLCAVSGVILGVIAGY